MNSFQLKTLEKAIRNNHVLDLFERDFIANIKTKPKNYTLTYRQNHFLNKISDKVYIG